MTPVTTLSAVHLVNTCFERLHKERRKNQIQGSQPAQTLPSTFGSMAWSSRQSTCSSTDKPSAGSLARILCSFVPKATDCIAEKAPSFSKPSFSSSLEKKKQRKKKFTVQMMNEMKDDHDNKRNGDNRGCYQCVKKIAPPHYTQKFVSNWKQKFSIQASQSLYNCVII